ncbi:hypothetical protein ACLB2K_054613 [Fragaria x ananassa]
MTKRRPSSLMRRLSRLKSRLIIILCVLLCVLAFLRLVLRSESNLQSSFPSTPRRSRGFIDAQFVGPPKVAFLFLVRQDLPLDFLWGTFFKNGDAAKFSIYIHSEPGFVLDETTTRSAFFFGRQLNNSIQISPSHWNVGVLALLSPNKLIEIILNSWFRNRIKQSIGKWEFRIGIC